MSVPLLGSRAGLKDPSIDAPRHGVAVRPLVFKLTRLDFKTRPGLHAREPAGALGPELCCGFVPARSDGPFAWEPEDPPPPIPPPLSLGTSLLYGAGLMALAALRVGSHGIFSLLVRIIELVTRDRRPVEDVLPAALATIEGTGPPAVRGDGLVECTRCAAAVPFETMALNEHGYFCRRCGPSQPVW